MQIKDVSVFAPQRDHLYVLKDSRSGKLRAIVQDVPSLAIAEAILSRLGDAVDASTETAEIPEAEA